MTKSELAVYKYHQGYNCAQAVACAFAEELGIEESVMYKMCEGFGAGMGTGCGICGALSGAALLAGFLNSNGDIDNAGATKASTYKLAGAIQRQFQDKVGSIVCKDIKMGANADHVTSCADCIAIAAQIAHETFFA